MRLAVARGSSGRSQTLTVVGTWGIDARACIRTNCTTTGRAAVVVSSSSFHGMVGVAPVLGSAVGPCATVGAVWPRGDATGDVEVGRLLTGVLPLRTRVMSATPKPVLYDCVAACDGIRGGGEAAGGTFAGRLQPAGIYPPRAHTGEQGCGRCRFGRSEGGVMPLWTTLDTEMVLRLSRAALLHRAVEGGVKRGQGALSTAPEAFRFVLCPQPLTWSFIHLGRPSTSPRRALAMY